MFLIKNNLFYFQRVPGKGTFKSIPSIVSLKVFSATSYGARGPTKGVIRNKKKWTETPK